MPKSFTLLMVMLFLLPGCRADRDAWERIKESGVLRIGIDPTFPPFALAEGERLEGIDIEIIRALVAELGLEPKFTYFGYDGLYDALVTGQVDVLISALVVAPERTKDIAYTNAYFDAGFILIVPEGTSDIKSMADLDGRVLAVELGSLGHVEALEWQKQLGDLAIMTHDSVTEALEAVAAGNADAALVDNVSGRLYLKEQTSNRVQLTRLPNAVTSEPYAIAVRIEDRNLLKELNRALERLVDAGNVDAIINRWLGP